MADHLVGLHDGPILQLSGGDGDAQRRRIQVEGEPGRIVPGYFRHLWERLLVDRQRVGPWAGGGETICREAGKPLLRS